MRRRDLLKSAAVGVATALAAPRLGRAETANKLVFVPTEDLSVLDPHLAGARSRRTLAYLALSAYGLRAPSYGPSRLEWGSTIGEQRSSPT